MENNKISRRKFTSQTATGAAFIAFAPVKDLPGSEIPQATWPQGAENYRIHMIGHTNIDPVWLWPWSEGVAITHSTFRANDVSGLLIIAVSGGSFIVLLTGLISSLTGLVMSVLVIGGCLLYLLWVSMNVRKN